MSSVEVRGIHKAYNNLTILDHIDLMIEDGHFVVILGPSGCGKSTLLNIIAGLEDTQDGQILIDGKDVTRLEPSERGLAMVFQSYALFPAMTVRGNLSFGMKVARTPKAVIDERVAWVSKLLQMEHLLDRRPSELSGGQRQRVAIGRALVRSTKICLFDEPLSNLDAKLRAETRIELKQLHAKLKSTMIYVTHDQIEAMTMADRVAVMNKGHVEQYDVPQTIYEKPASLFVAAFVGSPSMNFIDGDLSTKGTFDAAGLSLPTDGYVFAAPHATGKSVLGVRCENIAVVDRSVPGSAPATLAFVELLGADALGWFDCLGQRFSVKLSVDAARSMPQEVALQFDLTRASIFSKETGRRL